MLPGWVQESRNFFQDRQVNGRGVDQLARVTQPHTNQGNARICGSRAATLLVKEAEGGRASVFAGRCGDHAKRERGVGLEEYKR